MGDYKDNPAKGIIRTEWGKKLVSFIYSTLKYKLLYLGLPGVDLSDITEWLDYIDQIIAFQCRDYPNPSSSSQSRSKVVAIENKLKDLERKGLIKTFSLYDGYIEEVVLRGRDISGNIFSQNDVVTIYNLDFCNEITSPLPIVDDKGNTQRVYKSHAIKKLLEIQRDITASSRSKKFIMFLTVHASHRDKEMQIFQSQPESKYLKDYFHKIKRLTQEEKQIRFLKSYILDIIRCNYEHCNFSCYLLPAIYYKGTGEHRLVTFTIAGALDTSIRTYHIQKPEEFLRTPFLTVEKKRLILYSNSSIEDLPVNTIDPTDIIKNTKHFAKLWQNQKMGN
ncbi:MAG: hypothetical protein HY755_04185 [Nitrospirae bacterium]|nr:hypothetical protein [Nitrospirota bacterium]